MCCCLDSSIKINRDLPFSVSECGGGGGGVCSPMDGGGDDDDDGTPSEEALSLSRSNNTVSRSMAFIMTTHSKPRRIAPKQIEPENQGGVWRGEGREGGE